MCSHSLWNICISPWKHYVFMENWNKLSFSYLQMSSLSVLLNYILKFIVTPSISLLWLQTCQNLQNSSGINIHTLSMVACPAWFQTGPWHLNPFDRKIISHILLAVFLLKSMYHMSILWRVVNTLVIQYFFKFIIHINKHNFMSCFLSLQYLNLFPFFLYEFNAQIIHLFLFMASRDTAI